MERKNLRAGALLGPLPAVMVSVGDMENSNILTVAWTGILSTDPARLYISVRKSRHSYEMIKKTGEFVVNLTTECLARVTDYVGIYTGKKVDKFKACGLTKKKSEKVMPPTVAESPLSLECRVFNVIESGTHDIFMADIVNVSVREDLFDKDGRICLDRAKLIAYTHGEYFSLGKKLGKFGYSTDKKLGVPTVQREGKTASTEKKADTGKTLSKKKASKPGKRGKNK